MRYFNGRACFQANKKQLEMIKSLGCDYNVSIQQ